MGSSSIQRCCQRTDNVNQLIKEMFKASSLVLSRRAGSFRYMSVKPPISISGPSERYKKLCLENKLKQDEHQERAVTRLNQLHESLHGGHGQLSGIYMHAGVGRGKTMIMDLFCGGVGGGIKKQRVHYHEFMLQIHKKLYQKGGAKDPLHAVAGEIATSTRLLCIDELEITDVADAFVTRALFEKLWQQGVVTVFTTNCLPDALYKGGINRSSFVPFIDLIQQHCEVDEDW